jgi:hypothetical protein
MLNANQQQWLLCGIRTIMTTAALILMTFVLQQSQINSQPGDWKSR